MLLDICKAITLRWEKRNDAKTEILYLAGWSVAYRKRHVRVPFLQPIRIHDLQQLRVISKRRLGASLTQTLRLHILLSIRLSVWQSISYCFISGAVSLNSRRKDVKIGSSSHSRLRRARLLKLLLLQGRRRRYISRATSFKFTNSGRNSVKLIFM